MRDHVTWSCHVEWELLRKWGGFCFAAVQKLSLPWELLRDAVAEGMRAGGKVDGVLPVLRAITVLMVLTKCQAH